LPVANRHSMILWLNFFMNPSRILDVTSESDMLSAAGQEGGNFVTHVKVFDTIKRIRFF
jgi:hypothetical protein